MPEAGIRFQSGERSERKIRQGSERGAQGVAPALRDVLEVPVIALKTPLMGDPAFVQRLHQQVDRQVDAEVGAHGRIERNAKQLDRFLEAHVRVQGAHEYRAAILGFAGLEEGIVGARLDEVAFRVDQEQARIAAFYLPAQDQGRTEQRFRRGPGQ